MVVVSRYICRALKVLVYYILHLYFYKCAHVTSLFTDFPSEPRDLEIIKFDKTSVTLKWKAPTDDSGIPIQGMCLPLIEAFLTA